MKEELVDALRRPEYTGENRCLPCTVVNAVIAAVLGGTVAKKSKPAGLVVLVGSAALIYLRGYLIPGTPELTKRYLPPSVLRWFGKSPEADLATGFEDLEGPGSEARNGAESETEAEAESEPGAEPEQNAEPDTDPQSGADAASDPETGDPESGEAGAETDEQPLIPEDIETYFLDAGILEPCDDRDDLCLTQAFEAEWDDAMDAVAEAGVGPAEALEAFDTETDADPEEFELEENARGGYTLRLDTRRAGQWPSYAAVVADVAAAGILGSWLDEWDAYSPRQKGGILNSLRMFLETCPTAEGGVEMTEGTIQSCCSSNKVVAIVCEETGERLFEHQLFDEQGQPIRG
jgi:hypothetical protein